MHLCPLTVISIARPRLVVESLDQKFSITRTSRARIYNSQEAFPFPDFRAALSIRCRKWRARLHRLPKSLKTATLACSRLSPTSNRTCAPLTPRAAARAADRRSEQPQSRVKDHPLIKRGGQFHRRISIAAVNYRRGKQFRRYPRESETASRP